MKSTDTSMPNRSQFMLIADIKKKRKRANHKINVKNLENNIVSFLKN